MFKNVSLAITISTVVFVSGCTTHLSDGAKREYDAYEQKGLLQKEKSVAVAAVLGIFPVAGYAYAGHPVLAVTTIPLWPFLGPLWMPYDTAQSAMNRNYYATKEFVAREQKKELREIDHELEDKKIDYQQHLRKQREIEDKYSAY